MYVFIETWLVPERKQRPPVLEPGQNGRPIFQHVPPNELLALRSCSTEMYVCIYVCLCMQ